MIIGTRTPNSRANSTLQDDRAYIQRNQMIEIDCLEIDVNFNVSRYIILAWFTRFGYVRLKIEFGANSRLVRVYQWYLLLCVIHKKQPLIDYSLILYGNHF